MSIIDAYELDDLNADAAISRAVAKTLRCSVADVPAKVDALLALQARLDAEKASLSARLEKPAASG